MSESTTSSPTLEALRAKREEILRIAAAHGVTNVRIFGSVARGDAGAASDVDFVVDLAIEARGFYAFGILDDLRTQLEAVVGRPVHVVTLRGPFSPRGAAMAEGIECQALAL